MEAYEPLLRTLEKIAAKRNTTMSAMSLNYNISKGALPLVGMRRPEQAEQNIKALGWRLSPDEIKEIDNVSFEGKKYNSVAARINAGEISHQ